MNSPCVISTEKSALPAIAEGAPEKTGDPWIRQALFLVTDLGSRRGGLDFLELRKRPETRSFRLAGAAAGGGNERESGGGESGKEADHGEGSARFF